MQFRLVVLNPARAELHLLHPERHDKAARGRAGPPRRRCPQLEAAAGGPVIGSVSVRHDPMDAIEETIFSEPVDEIMLAVPAHHVSTWLHQDLAAPAGALRHPGDRRPPRPGRLNRPGQDPQEVTCTP